MMYDQQVIKMVGGSFRWLLYFAFGARDPLKSSQRVFKNTTDS